MVEEALPCVSATAALCPSQVELRRRPSVEQVRLHQHAAVCGRRSGRAGRGDAHHDVSGAQRKKEKKKIVILQTSVQPLFLPSVSKKTPHCAKFTSSTAVAAFPLC